jgi:hypothetical protein
LILVENSTIHNVTAPHKEGIPKLKDN